VAADLVADLAVAVFLEVVLAEAGKTSIQLAVTVGSAKNQ